MPELGAPLGVAVGALFLDPHGGRQDQVRGLRGHRGIGIGDDDEIVRVAVAGQGFLVEVGRRLHVVVHLHPVGVDLAVLEIAVLLHRVRADPAGQQALGQLPLPLGEPPVFGVFHHHVGGQAMGEGADFARGAAGRGLAGQRERAVARGGDLAGQQVQVVDHVVHPHAARVLVDAHGPQRHHPGIRVGVQLGELFQAVFRHAAQRGNALGVVLIDEGREFLEVDGRGPAGLVVIGRLALQRVLRAQAVADIAVAAAKIDVAANKIFVDPLAADDVPGDVVENRQVGLRREHHGDIRQFERAVLEGGHHADLDVRIAEPAVGQTGPQNGVHLGHVGAPQHEGVGVLEIVIAAHGLVDAEAAHKTGHGRGHAVARVGVDVVGQKAGLVQLGGGIALPYGPLAGAEHADTARAFVLKGRLELLFHHIEGPLPAHRGELALFVVAPVAQAQQRPGQAVFAVHDLGQEIALDAGQTLVDRRVDIAVGGDHAVVAGGHVQAAPGAAETAGGLGPLEPVVGGDQVGRGGGCGDTGGRGRRGDGVGAYEVATSRGHGGLLNGFDLVEGQAGADHARRGFDGGDTLQQGRLVAQLQQRDQPGALVAGRHLRVGQRRDGPPRLGEALGSAVHDQADKVGVPSAGEQRASSERHITAPPADRAAFGSSTPQTRSRRQ